MFSVSFRTIVMQKMSICVSKRHLFTYFHYDFDDISMDGENLYISYTALFNENCPIVWGFQFLCHPPRLSAIAIDVCAQLNSGHIFLDSPYVYVYLN